MKQISIAPYSRISLYTLFFICLFGSFTSCTKEYTPESKNTSSTSSSATAATVSHQHFDFPGPYDFMNYCTGETVTTTGTIGDDMYIVINGNTMNFSEHQQGQLQGTGSLGNAYLTNINENVTLNGISSNNGVFIIDDVTVFRMISKSGETNFTVRRIAHLTINANGTVTVTGLHFEASCPG